MFSSRQTGPVYTSIQLHPIKLLMLAIALAIVGLVMMASLLLWALILGLACVLLGAWLAYIAGRQVGRAMRTFLS